MGMMLQVTWQLMHLLCIIAIATIVPGSSGFGETLSLESSSPIISIEAQVPSSIDARGLNLQPPIVSPFTKSPTVYQKIQGSLPFLSPSESTRPPPQQDLRTSIPTQTLDDLAPPLPAESTYHPTSTAAAPQVSSPTPVAGVSHGLAPALPVAESPFYTNPPPSAESSNNLSMTPSSESPHVSAISSAEPPESIPQLPTAEPPVTSPVALLAPPPEVSRPTSTIQSPPVAEPPVIVVAPSHQSPQPPFTEPPHSSALPLAVKPPEFEPTSSVAEPSQGWTMTPPPTAVLPPEISQPTSTIQSPPITPSEAPIVSPQPPIAKPPYRTALPLAAKTPDSNPPLPVAEPPPQGLTMTPTEAPPNLSIPPPTIPPHSEDIQPPPVPINPSSSPTYTRSPPPQLDTPHAPPPMSTVPSNPSLLPPSMSPPSSKSPTALPSPLPLPPHTLTPPPQLKPPDVSSPPPELNPPTVNAPPPQLTPPISSASPPQVTPPIASSPPPKMSPTIVSTPPQVNPPIESSPPSEVNPPIVFAPPPQLNPPIISSPPPELNPPIVSAPPPQLNPPIVSSPPPEVIPPTVTSPPPELNPSNMSSPPPTVSSPPPQQIPPIASSPPPQLMPPISSSPPELIPPPVSPPISVVPPNSSVPPPKVSSPPRAVPPHASAIPPPPLPSHASPPQAALSPPYVLPAPPSLELPHTSPPHPPIVNGSVPSHASPPSPFSTPHLAPTSPLIRSNPLYAPPPIEPSHSSVPPPVTQRTVPAASPHSSQTKVPQEGAPPPSPASSEPSPPSKTLPEGAPPAHQVTPRSRPPSSHQIEAPKHAPFMRSNDSEPDTSPSSTPPPRKSISGRHPSMAPPARAPDQSPRDNLSPYHAPSKPRFESHNASAPAPFHFTVYPRHNESHHSPRHSPVKGSPSAMTPLQSPETPEISSAPSPLPKDPPGHSGISFPSPKISPSGSSTRNTKKPLAPPILSLPPPPPNADCAYLTCPEPFTNTPPGSPCSCVWPMQVGLRLSVALFTFFPLVTELSREIAAGVFMKQSQVRVMGANAASEQSEKTIVLVDLVPLHEKFDNVTSELTFQRFWHKQVVIDKSKFGDYEVLYVRYPGLPPSPPMAPADMAIINGMPYSVRDPNQSKAHPLGVDVTKQGHKRRLSGIIIAAIVFAAIVGVLICCSVAWVLVFRHKNLDPQPGQTPRALPSLARLSGPTGNSTGSGPSSSMSIGSSLATYTGSAKTFSASEIEQATDNLSPSRIIGEGGFGLVYGGVLEDETSVAVKVLKRDDHQGGREFLAEVEMLSRLHHRNLVKLIGICTDEHLRCLVYELIPNGSVDSHLHGADREIAPLDWASRMKIALGAARGLAYLHEDSSPRVIHRDFKSSNILLENDFTPKVSDFGLARTAMDEENKHISTRVMGTFGYVAPEYAMTGHLLVKSDVYSYGVVLLELLTGRKPVDMSQPPGQENIVAWTRPFLSTKEGLELILDPSLGSDVPLDSLLKVAAIASMCVQPEVSHRPFMGEVVQALKLVCNECDDSKDGNSRPPSHENLLLDFEAKGSPVSETHDYLPTQFSHQNFLPADDVEKGVSVSEIFGAQAQIDRQASNSFRRHSASGPLKTGRGRQFWQRIGRRSNGSASEHSMMYRLWSH